MDSFIENCLVAAEPLSAFPPGKLLQYPHPVKIVLLDIETLARQTEFQGWEYVITKFLSGQEQLAMRAFTSEKRRIEWLGGRIAAKYVTVRLFEQEGDILHFPDIRVSAAKNGRPFLSVSKRIRRQGDIPDISISHSGSMAAAMASRKEFCGIDIQKITPKVIKVQERFCTPSEKLILQGPCPCRPEMAATMLTKLWAAKEALRKASTREPLPGFLEMRLLEIQEAPSHMAATSWIFVCNVHHGGTPANRQYRVFITVVKDYILAVTAGNDTLR